MDSPLTKYSRESQISKSRWATSSLASKAVVYLSKDVTSDVSLSTSAVSSHEETSITITIKYKRFLIMMFSPKCALK